MGISEFTVHNVLRTYSRQERLGQIHKTKVRGADAPRAGDQVCLSPTGQKVRSLGQLAAEMVDRQDPDLAPDEKWVQTRRTMDELLDRHADEVRDDAVSPEALEADLRPRYLR